MTELNKQAITALTDEKIKSLSEQDIFNVLQSSKDGLSSQEASARLQQFGSNALEEKEDSALKKFLRYFWGPIPWMIEAAAILSLVVQDWEDFGIIMGMLIFNALIGFWEEHKASNALAALKAGLALKAKALRDGKWNEVEAATLVPGDVIRIRLGDIVPADVKLIDGDYVSIDQAALTGESLPVGKKVGETAYSGSVVKQGEMVAVVTGTGNNTFFGRTAKLVASAGAVSHFQQAVMRIGDFLIFVSIALSLVLIGVILWRDYNSAVGIDLNNTLQLVKFVLLLVIASIPVAMPAVLSVTMALGALSLSKRKAIVSRLQAIEEMAGVDILCSDKTGTLTKNQLTLGDTALFGASDDQECILAAALASKEEDQDAIDLAVLGGLKNHDEYDKYKQAKFTPFDPVSKRTEAIVTGPDGKTSWVTKGAPQVIVDMAKLDKQQEDKAEKAVADLASHGFRALGVARSVDDGKTWNFLGILSLFDPPRDDSASTIAQAEKYGIDVKMVTGDDTAIASEIAGKLGLGTHIQPASDLFEGVKDPGNLPDDKAAAIEKADGFARVFPEHKYGIVKALQKRGHIVAMTGDGVNDAPALKQADCGVAVSGATDAARAAAALVLTAPGLSVITRAVETARQIFQRMTSYTVYRIAMTIDVMFFVVLAMLLYEGSPPPLTAVMIVLLALLDDIPIMTIAYDNTCLDPKPVRWRMGRVLLISGLLGVVAVIETFGLLAYARMNIGEMIWGVTLDSSHIQTMMFLQLVLGGHLMLFVTRTERPFFMKPWPAMPLLGAILGTQIFAAGLCWIGWGKVIPALPWQLIGLVWAYNLIWMLVQDIVKLGFYRLFDHRTHRGRHLNKLWSTTLHHHKHLHQN